MTFEIVLMMMPFLGLGEMFSDFNIMLKLFVLISIASFAQNHLGKGPLTLLFILGIAYFVFFAEGLWPLFGGVFIFYLLLMIGISGLMIDYIFVAVNPLGSGKKAMEDFNPYESSMSSGKDLAMRGQQMQRAQQMLGGHRGHRPPPMVG